MDSVLNFNVVFHTFSVYHCYEIYNEYVPSYSMLHIFHILISQGCIEHKFINYSTLECLSLVYSRDEIELFIGIDFFT